MQGLFWEADAGVHLVIRGLVVVLGFWTAWRAGTAAAEGWGRMGRAVLYAALLAGGMQFLHFALFQGPMLSLRFYLIDLGSLAGLAVLGFRMRRTSQMVGAYGWLYEKVTPVSWRSRG